MTRMLIAADIGYGYTKANNHSIIKSAITTVNDTIYDPNSITVNGLKYYYGRGTDCNDVNKVKSLHNMILTLSCITEQNAHEVDLSVGLPVGQFYTQREELEETILSYNDNKILFNNKPYDFHINNVVVNPQGVSSIYMLQNYNNYNELLLIDCGGQTVDVSELELSNGICHIIHPHSFPLGIKRIYAQIIELINNTYDMRLKPDYAEKILLRQKLLKDGQEVDISIIKKILKAYMDELAQNINDVYDTSHITMVLTGGASEFLYPYLNKIFKDRMIKLSNPIFTNVDGYYKIAAKKLKY